MRKKVFSAKEQYPWEECLPEAQEQIQASYGLKLSALELREFKRHFLASTNELQELADSCPKPLYSSVRYIQKSFDPVDDAITRFMMTEYDCSWELARVHTTRSQERGIELYLSHTEEFKEYLRRVQERKHLP